jgi:hypothetical protein
MLYIDITLFMEKSMRTDILEKRPQIESWILENKSKTFMCNQLQCKVTTLDKYMSIMGIKYSGNKSGKGEHKNKPRLTIFEYLENSSSIQSGKIRKKLLESGIREHKCERCGNSTWLGNPIPLEAHHKDGNPNHNTLDNIELVCPNCHAFTDTYRGKNCKH